MSYAVATTIPKRRRDLRWIMRLLSALFVTDLVLSVPLLFVPYSLYNAYGEYVYQVTHNARLDPLNWFPYSLENFGPFFYSLAFVVWFFTTNFALPLFVFQAINIYQYWTRLARTERVFHSLALTATILLAGFLFIFGQPILVWLLD